MNAANAVALFIMGEKGFNVLEGIVSSHKDLIEMVVCSRDNDVQEDYYDQIRDFCLANDLPFFERLKFPAPRSPYAFAIAWRWLIQLEDTRLIVFHDSILPRHRGFNPLVTSLINGDRQIGVTALFAEADYDAGDIIAQEIVGIDYPIKIQTAISLIATAYKLLAGRLLDRIVEEGYLPSVTQEESKATYSLWRDKEDYRIDWSMSSEQIARFVDSVGYPYLGASTLVNGTLARVQEVEIMQDVTIENRVPGKVIFVKDGNPVIVCGKGLLKIVAGTFDETGASLLPLTKFRSRFQ